MRKFLFINGEHIKGFFDLDLEKGVKLIENYFLNNGVVQDSPNMIANFFNERYELTHELSKRDVIEFAKESNKLIVVKLEKGNRINNTRYIIKNKNKL